MNQENKLEDNFEMRLTLDDKSHNSVESCNINLSNLSKNEIFILYSEDKIILKDIINEFQNRNLDLWKEYKLYQNKLT